MRRFGRKLHRLLSSREAYEILGEGTWMSGGCWILAEALHRCLSDRGFVSSLYAVRSHQKAHEVIEHVVVRIEYGDVWYFDGDGAATETELLRKMKHVERVPEPYLTRFSKKDAKAERDFPFGIACPPIRVKKLTAWLCERL
jgi:hypothetical protein